MRSGSNPLSFGIGRAALNIEFLQQGVQTRSVNNQVGLPDGEVFDFVKSLEKTHLRCSVLFCA